MIEALKNVKPNKSGVPPHENYKYVRSLEERLKHCGTINKVFCDDKRIFFEFDEEIDKYGGQHMFNRKSSLLRIGSFLMNSVEQRVQNLAEPYSAFISLLGTKFRTLSGSL